MTGDDGARARLVIADDAAAGAAGDLRLDLTDAEIGRGRECLDLADDALWEATPPEVFAACFGRAHAGGDALADER